jgi:hypothetical protein
MKDPRWLHGMNGDFGTAADWSGEKVPGPSDYAYIKGYKDQGYTVTVDENESVAGLTATTHTHESPISININAATLKAGFVLNYDVISLDHGSLVVANQLANYGEIEGYSNSTLFATTVINDLQIAAVEGKFTVQGPVSGAGRVIIDGGNIIFADTFNQIVIFTTKGGELSLSRLGYILQRLPVFLRGARPRLI